MSAAKQSTEGLPHEAIPVNEFDRDVALLLAAENRDPFRLLGPHIVEENDQRRLVVRFAYRRVDADDASWKTLLCPLKKKASRRGKCTIPTRFLPCFPISICI